MSAYKLAIYDLFLELLSFKTDFRTIPTDLTKLKTNKKFFFCHEKKNSHLARDGG